MSLCGLCVNIPIHTAWIDGFDPEDDPREQICQFILNEGFVEYHRRQAHVFDEPLTVDNVYRPDEAPDLMADFHSWLPKNKTTETFFYPDGTTMEDPSTALAHVNTCDYLVSWSLLR